MHTLTRLSELNTVIKKLISMILPIEETEISNLLDMVLSEVFLTTDTVSHIAFSKT